MAHRGDGNSDSRFLFAAAFFPLKAALFPLFPFPLVAALVRFFLSALRGGTSGLSLRLDERLRLLELPL